MSEINRSVIALEKWEKCHLAAMVLIGPIMMLIFYLVYFGFFYRSL